MELESPEICRARREDAGFEDGGKLEYPRRRVQSVTGLQILLNAGHSS